MLTRSWAHRVQRILHAPKVCGVVEGTWLRTLETATRRQSTFPSTASHANRPSHSDRNRLGWRPGQEPGLDPSTITHVDRLPHTKCDITVVDFSKDDIKTHELENDTLPAWIESCGVREEWVKCRWINVNGISWDVIQALGNYKGLHRLAVEDMVNRETRTKVDWYPEHMHIMLTLQKLVDFGRNNISPDRAGASTSTAQKKPQSLTGRMMGLHDSGRFHHHKSPFPGHSIDTRYSHSNDGLISARSEKNGEEFIQELRTLQGHRCGADIQRIAFMESHSPLTRHNLAVCAEQVSIFLLSDNTVISFFESSANDIEATMLARLYSQDTVLRRSDDASMVAQSIIDIIIDLAMPVTAAYQDAIGSLEIEVLTEPNINHARELYTITSEITSLQNAISPMAALITSLQDSRPGLSPTSSQPESIIGVQISPMTQMYLRDVKDHCLILSQTLGQLHISAHDMINLIFNSITAYQNESMKKLTIATIMFLPLTFITGYFGMNLTEFPSLNNNEAFFWSIAAPVAMGTALMLGSGRFWNWMLKRRLRRRTTRWR